MINMEVHNWNLCVADVKIDAITQSSVFLIGDNDEITLSSFYDTPPEAAVLGPIVPISSTI